MNICLAKSISVIFCIISHKRYLNWQNYDFLEEIIEEYGDAELKGEFDGYCKKIEMVENKTSLKDIKNIVFTPLGTYSLLMKVPIPNQFAEPTLARSESLMAIAQKIKSKTSLKDQDTSPTDPSTPPASLEEVPPQVREEIESLAKSFNNLRILTYHHLESLKVNPDELRVIVCYPERQWEGDDHKNVCLAKSISVIFSIISHRRYLNWQNYHLLEEIIGAYGDAELKGEFDGYCKKIEVVEKTSLKDIKNIVFTPLGTYSLLMKVPIPNQIAEPTLARSESLMEKNENKTSLKDQDTSPTDPSTPPASEVTTPTTTTCISGPLMDVAMQNREVPYKNMRELLPSK